MVVAVDRDTVRMTYSRILDVGHGCPN
jgi:hypothetical protein